MELRQETTHRQQQIPSALIGTSQEVARLREFVQRAAPKDASILLLGETGTGKDHLAEMIHKLGRPQQNLVPIIGEAMSDSLFESGKYPVL